MERSGVDFILLEAWQAIRRNPLITLASIGNMAICLLILGAFFLGAINLDYMASLQAKSAVISVYLKPNADAGEIESQLYSDLRVKETEFVSKEDAIAEWAEMNNIPAEALKIIDNPLPDSVRVKVVNPDDLAAVSEMALQIDGVDDAVYSRAVTDKIVTLSHGIKVAGLALGILLVAGTMLIVGTTIRLTIYARRLEIRIMQLVGATNWFIRGPFLFEGGFQGSIGGIIAALGLTLGYVFFHGYLAETLQFVKLVYSGQFLAAYAVGLIFSGTLFGVAGALISVNRYLSKE